MHGSGRLSPARSEARRSSSHPALRPRPPSAPGGYARADRARCLSPQTPSPVPALRSTFPYSRGSSIEVRPGRLTPAEIDPQLLGRPEDVLVGLAQLDLITR